MAKTIGISLWAIVSITAKLFASGYFQQRNFLIIV